MPVAVAGMPVAIVFRVVFPGFRRGGGGRRTFCQQFPQMRDVGFGTAGPVAGAPDHVAFCYSPAAPSCASGKAALAAQRSSAGSIRTL